MSTKWPSIAAAAAICGDTRWVRPPRPWRPSKLRLEVDAQRSPARGCPGSCPGTSSSPRCASRSRRRGRSRPAPRSRPAWPPAGSPGRPSRRRCVATLRPLIISAAARRSPMRALVQEPMKTRSSLSSLHRRAGLQAHVDERALVGLRAAARARRRRPATTWPGFVPQVTTGETALASTVISRSNVAPSSVFSVRQYVSASSKSSGAPGRPCDPVEGRLVGRDHARAAAALDRHVADRHPLFHRHRPR